MRLLLFAPVAVAPPRSGAGTRIRHLARELQRRGHELTVVSFEDAPDRYPPAPAAGFEHVALSWSAARRTRRDRWLGRFGLWGRTPVSPRNVETIGRILRAKHFDAVVVENVHLSELLPLVAGHPMVWVEEGIFSELRHPSLRGARGPYRRLQEWITYALWRRLERWCWSRADVVVAVSERDAAVVRRRLRHRRPVVVVPNGVDVASFLGTRRADAADGALFVGSRWYPNVEALHFFVGSVLPRVRGELAGFRLTVAGDVCDSRELRLPATEGVELLGFVHDLRACYATSRVFVVPILRGHGTRLKILEAMAAGIPVVSTRKGAEGLDLRDGQDLLLADDPPAFARAVARLARDPGVADALASSGRARVAELYDWSAACDRFEDALALLPSASWSRGANERRRSIA